MEASLDPADFEKLGVFYLGRTAEVTGGGPAGGPFLYDSRHLTTHGVVIGMTGSGKTGLSIGLLEEAAIDGIPAIVVDPKGDLGNLLLQFPNLAPADFAPWVPHGSTADEEAKRWKEGLAAWGQDGARIARLKSAAEVTIYTPGSRSGRPISIAGSLAAPDDRSDEEAINERVGQVALSLLGLVGIQAEPGKSREHVLLATIIQKAWATGESLDLAGLVLRIQDPPFDKLGVLGLEQFFPKKERFELAVAYNALLATPGFDAWLDGPPLDIARLLWSKEGKPRISVLSIAHLDDAQRMFFVSLLLGQLLSWIRTQPGTPSLRALFFMDEVVGYFPPVAMPPSKRPLLMLLKQARAFGLGVVLATQNPVDLDYKGLANAGTWMIGRLQTERDKARVLEGLEGAASGGFSRENVDRILSSLQKRHFYVHDVHAAPAVIESRWTLSYLRGPLTRDEIKRLAGPREAAKMVQPPAATTTGADRPVLAPEVTEVFFPTTNPSPLYRPFVIGAAKVHFADEKTGLDFTREVMFATPIADGPVPVRWEDSKWVGATPVRDLASEPVPNARFVAPPADAVTKKSYATWEKELTKWLAQTQGVARLKSKEHKLLSNPGEDERSFRGRLALLGREARDEAIEEIRASIGKKLATVEEKIRKKQCAVAAADDASRFGMMDAAISVFSRGGIAGAARKAGKASAKAKSSAREKEDLATLIAKHGELSREMQTALAEAATQNDPATTPLESVVNKPKKTGITIHLVAVGWRAD